jgi:hypothetical protein
MFGAILIPPWGMKFWKGKIEDAKCKVHDNGVGENGRDNATSEGNKMKQQDATIVTQQT